MRKSKRKRDIIRVMNAFFAGILTILGFNNCDKIFEGGVDEYGTPHADYSIKGSVKDKDGNAIPGIKVSMSFRHSELEDTAAVTTSDEKGKYSLNQTEFPSSEIKIIAEDVDGEKNGLFKNKTEKITIKSDDYKNSSGAWFYGTVEKEVNFQLEEKEKGE